MSRSGSLPLTGTGVSAAVSPGTYVLSVQAANLCGPVKATSTQTVHVPWWDTSYIFGAGSIR